MAYTTPLTAVALSPLTAAQWNASVRDNFLETGPAKATAAGRLLVTTAAGAIAERVPQVQRIVGGGQSTTLATFTDLTTVGPTCANVLTGTAAIYIVSAFIQNNSAGQGGYMGVAVSGASSIAADSNRALRIMSGAIGENSKQSYAGMFFPASGNGLTAGANTFQAKYSVVATGQATFDERELIIIPL